VRGSATVRDDFDGDQLDLDIWFPYYLPAWSSRAATAAAYEVHDSRLRLSIATDAPLWCPDQHPAPLRVSGIASGSRSGAVGSTEGQQRFLDGQRVREQQPHFEGWLPTSGRVAARCRMEVSPRSMAAVWLSGFEEQPDDAGELCLVEVFGRNVKEDSAEVGVGVKQLHDPRLVHDFVAPRLSIDVLEFHEYVVEWNVDGAEFFVDNVRVHATTTAPSYPMQVMVGVFDFPDWSTGDDDQLVPAIEVDSITGT
jgi:hypothetical protein